MYQQGNSEVLEIARWVRHSFLKEFTSSIEGKKEKGKKEGRWERAGRKEVRMKEWRSVEEGGYYNFLIINRVIGTDIDSTSFNSQKYNLSSLFILILYIREIQYQKKKHKFS